tara:strand:+ start:665 stop:1585 length:921 start_codon:yes stop_codon:yes gene_type:complete
MNIPNPNMGRFGDTFVRPVDGEMSHVNATEAQMIDNLGPLGQFMTKQMGAGTRNPQTGAKEYFPWMLAAQAVGTGLKAYGAYKNAQNIKNQDTMGNYKDSIAHTQKLQGIADGLMDPGSTINMRQSQDIKEKGMDQLAMSNMLNNRNAAQGGASNYSGILNQQNQANLDRQQQMNLNAIQNQQNQNYNRGLQMQGNLTSNYQNMDSIRHQDQINKMSADNAMRGAITGGLGTALGALGMAGSQSFMPGDVTTDTFSNVQNQMAADGNQFANLMIGDPNAQVINQAMPGQDSGFWSNLWNNVSGLWG